MRHVLLLALLQGACNLVGIVDGLIYAWLAVHPAVGAGDSSLLLNWALCATIVSYALVPMVLFPLLLPIGRAFDALARDPAAAAPEASRRCVLNAPLHMSRVSLAAWLLSAATLVPLAPYLKAADPTALILHIIMVTLLIGSVASTFVYYAAEAYLRAYVIPVLVPDGLVTRIPGVTRVPISFKVTVLVLTTSVLPISILTVASTLGAATPATAAYLGVSFLLLGALQTLAICASITRPLTQLAGETEKVRDENLDARVRVVSADVIGLLGERFNDMVAGLRRGRFVKDTFGRYVSRQVLDQILDGKVPLGGEKRLASILFSDIRGFTALAERLPPEEVVGFLNRYLDIMVDVLVEHGGTIDKFIGDAILATFGVPLAREDDAHRAVQAGLGMLARLRAWNAQRAAAGELPIEIGIGIHTGEVVAGNIGSAKKMEYTVIGDTVNTSSRIEQLNKNLGTSLLISEETYARVKDCVRARPLEPVEVKGKRRPLFLYEVTAWAGRPEAVGAQSP